MEIKNYKSIANAGCLKATFTLVMKTEKGNGHFDCQHFSKEGGGDWVNYAGKEYSTKDGKRKNWNQARWPETNFKDLTTEVLGLLKTETHPLPF